MKSTIEQSPENIVRSNSKNPLMNPSLEVAQGPPSPGGEGTRVRLTISNIIIYVLPLPLLLFSLMVGPSPDIHFGDYFTWMGKLLTGKTIDENTQTALIQNIVQNVRLPRVLLTYIIGAGLATSGASLQAIFRNPLVDPYVLGISSGAAFGAALVIAYPFLSINLSAFIFGVLSVVFTYSFASNRQNTSIVAIVLSGMIVSGIFTALLTIVQYISDPYKLQAIVQWTMGNLHHASWQKFNQAILPIGAGLLLLFIFRWRLNLLSLGDEEAKAVGVNPAKEKFLLIALATLITTSSVASAGIISMYGLFVPHIVRMLVGPDNRKAIPANIFFGGSFLLIIDNFSRSLMAFEIPIGIFTMLLGAPFFIFLMKCNKINWVQ